MLRSNGCQSYIGFSPTRPSYLLRVADLILIFGDGVWTFGRFRCDVHLECLGCSSFSSPVSRLFESCQSKSLAVPTTSHCYRHTVHLHLWIRCRSFFILLCPPPLSGCCVCHSWAGPPYIFKHWTLGRAVGPGKDPLGRRRRRQIENTDAQREGMGN